MRNCLIPLALFASCPVLAQDGVEEDRYIDEELCAEKVHSDLPLYDFSWEDFWPRSSIPEGSIAGCASRVRFGDWQFTPNPIDEFGDGSWWRITNYGVFHCMAIFREEDEREYLGDAEFGHGFFAQIGETDQVGRDIELWVMQRGTLPGSDYVILAREPGEEIINEFAVLQRRCPDGAMREFEGSLDILLTDYCAINSRAALVALAIEMLELPPLGTISWQGDGDYVPPEKSDEDAEPIIQDGSFLLEILGNSAQ